MANGPALMDADWTAFEWIAEVLEVQLTKFVRGIIGHMANVAVHRHAIDAGQASTVRALHFLDQGRSVVDIQPAVGRKVWSTRGPQGLTMSPRHMNGFVQRCRASRVT